MKENVLDVLMYLFQNYMSDDTEIHPDRELTQSELIEAGFSSQEVNQAFEWLEGLSDRQQTRLTVHSRSCRIYVQQELERLDMECRGFLLYLEQAGILTPETRELVIDRVMALETEEVDIVDLKWVILMVLFNHPDQEEAYAWMEDLVFEDTAGYAH